MEDASGRAISTVVVVDLVEPGDGAAWRASAASAVGRHRGAVIELEGVHLVAEFRGGPSAEHDAERAVEAAGELGAASFLRAGIDTGLAPRALAEALAGVCPGGSVLVSATAARRVRGRYQLRALPPMQLDARRPPVALHELVARRRHGVRLPVSGVRGVETELVGRREEMHRLWSCFSESARRRRPALAVVSGDAGVGKSRVVRELLPYLDARGDAVSLLAAPGGRAGGAAPYPFVDDLLACAAGVGPGREPEAARAAIEAAVREVFAGRRAGDELLVLSGPDELERVTRTLLRAAGRAPDDAPGERTPHAAARFLQVIDALRSWLRAAAARGPLVLVAEDLHEAGELALEVLDELLHTEDLPLLVLATCRAGAALERLDVLRGPRLTLTLQPLDTEGSRAMVESALRRVHLRGQEVTEAIAARAGGNPLFVEELVQHLIDAGALVDDPALGWLLATRTIDPASLPDSAARAVHVRIERLSPAGCELLARAAVLGTAFGGDELATLCGGAVGARPVLDEVLAHGLLTADDEVALDAAGAFRFAHDLVREVAHELTSLHDRQRLNLVIADYLRARAGTDPAAHPHDLARTARHLIAAADHDRAAVWAARAGDAARALWARGDAVALYRAALEALDASRQQLQALRVGVPERLGDALAEAGRHAAAIEAYDRLLIELGDPLERARVVLKRGRALEGGGNRDAAAGAFRKALADAQGAPAGRARQLVLARALHLLGRNRHQAGDFYAAGDCYRKGLDTCVEGAGETLEAASLHAGMAALAGERGHVALAIRHLERAVEIERRIGDEASEAACRVDLAGALAKSARHAEAADCLREAISLKDRLGDRPGLSAARAQLAEVLRAAQAAAT